MRQFLAIEIPQRLKERLADLRRDLGAGPGWKWVAPSSIHLTVRFLGEVDQEQDTRARPAWREAAGQAEPFRMRLSGLGTFPPRGRPRVLWVGVQDEARGQRLAGLAESVERAARRVGFAAESRAFHPHLTLARARGPARAISPESAPGVAPEEAAATELVLFRSELLPAGASHTRVEAFPLGH